MLLSATLSLSRARALSKVNQRGGASQERRKGPGEFWRPTITKELPNPWVRLSRHPTTQ